MFLLLSAALVAADQLIKLWVQQTLPLGGPGRYLGLGFYFTYVRNTGAAFGILQDGTLVLGLLSALVSGLIVVYLLRRGPRLGALQRTALSLILAGALGNMIDRFRLGYVTDFIHFSVPGFSFPVFNLADIWVVTGAGLLLLASALGGPRARPEAAREQELGEAEVLFERERG